MPWTARAANSQITESASMNSTDAPISAASDTISTGRRPASSDARPATSSVASTPIAYVA